MAIGLRLPLRVASRLWKAAEDARKHPALAMYFHREMGVMLKKMMLGRRPQFRTWETALKRAERRKKVRLAQKLMEGRIHPN